MPPSRIRFNPEWGCYPLWDDATGEPLELGAIGLPPDLAARIDAWDGLFQAILDQNYPPDSKFASPEAEAAWVAEGKALAEELRRVLPPGAFVDRFSARFG